MYDRFEPMSNGKDYFTWFVCKTAGGLAAEDMEINEIPENVQVKKVDDVMEILS